MIHEKDTKWEELVPKFVAEKIKTNKMFGYKN